MVLNLSETKEMVFHRPHPSKFCLPPSSEGIKRVQTAKLLGVVFHDSFSFITARAYATAVLGVVILSVRPSVRLSVCHTRGL